MRERLLTAATALARLVMVVVAFGLAVGSIGLASVRGFCPELGGSAGSVVLASIVEPDADSPLDPSPTSAPEAPADGGADQEAPADGATEDESAGACPGVAQRCLPPMWSSILILGEPACHDQAPARLRSTLVPAFVGSTVLLAGAWWLRPSRLPVGDRRSTSRSG